MSYVKAEPASKNVHLWSPAPASVNRAYHKIWGWVKRNAPTAIYWGGGEAYGIVEQTICKVAYQCGRSLPSNDLAKLVVGGFGCQSGLL